MRLIAALERALAGFDTRHRFTLNAVWEMPFFKSPGSNAFLRAVAGGWQLSGFAIIDSGQPFSILNSAAYTNGGDYNYDNNTGDRPNAPAGTFQTTGFSEQQFLNGVFAASLFGKPSSRARRHAGSKRLWWTTFLPGGFFASEAIQHHGAVLGFVPR